MINELSEISRLAAPAWVDHTIWWQVYPFGATGTPIHPGLDVPLIEPGAPTRLDHLEPWLNYAVELDANGLSLGPIFTSFTHSYDTTGYLHIDPHLGDSAAFDRLAEAYRARDLSPMLDDVLGHADTEYPLFRATCVEGEKCSLFRFDGAPVGGGADGSDVGPTGPGYATFEGYESLAALNHDSAEVRDLAM